MRPLTILSALVLFGCAAGIKAPPQQAPIRIREGEAASIIFTRLVITVPAGQNIGGHYDGLLKIKQSTHKWEYGIQVATSDFALEASQVLQSAGYDVKGATQDNLLFGAAQGGGTAEYMLGATIDSLRINTYAPLAGNYVETAIRVKWDLYDSFRKEIVFTERTLGYAKLSPYSSSAVWKEAFRSSLGNLLSSRAFVAQMARKPSEHWAAIADTLQKLVIKKCDARLAVPIDLEEALEATFVVRLGGGHGSGVVVSRDGYALTAAHVVDDNDQVLVSLHSGLELMANVIRVDKGQDIALIKLPGRGHQCLPVHSGANPSIGSELYAIGAPFSEDFAYTVTRGVVSGYRSINNIDYLQTDASLNKGNSGGALLTQDGTVAAIVSWKIVAEGFEGLAFGIPFDAIDSRLGISWIE